MDLELQRYFIILREKLEKYSLYHLETEKGAEEKVIKQLLKYLSNIGIDGNKDKICKQECWKKYKLTTVKEISSEEVIHIDIDLIYTEIPESIKGTKKSIVPIAKVKIRKNYYSFNPNKGAIKASCQSDIVITKDGAYGNISNLNKRLETITTLIKGKVIIPNSNRQETKTIDNIPIDDVLIYAQRINNQEVHNSNLSIENEERLEKERLEKERLEKESHRLKLDINLSIRL